MSKGHKCAPNVSVLIGQSLYGTFIKGNPKERREAFCGSSSIWDSIMDAFVF